MRSQAPHEKYLLQFGLFITKLGPLELGYPPTKIGCNTLEAIYTQLNQINYLPLCAIWYIDLALSS